MDEKYAESYAIGKDGVKFYDKPLSKEEIPIGVLYRIKNPNNIIGAIPEGELLPDMPELGDLAGKYREFTAESIPPELYEVISLYIMDDYTQPEGHRRSDSRDILERFTVDNPSQLPEIIQKVKDRVSELDNQG